MKLEHVALSVTDRNEIERFYQDILGMTVIRSFQMDEALAFDHIWISTMQREALVKKAKQNSYRVFHLKREHTDLVFISDNIGNTFEIKESKRWPLDYQI